MRNLNVVFILAVSLVVAAICQIQVTGRVCEVVNASEPLDLVFQQSWHVHCIGTVEEPPIVGWSVEGKHVCVALTCLGVPAPTKVEGVHGYRKMMDSVICWHLRVVSILVH